VYIQEAHPIDAWQDDDNIKAHISLLSTRTVAERCAVAGACMVKLGIEFPALIDDMQNSVERAYTGWPDRLYVIDRDGRVAYKSAAGPFGFHPAEVASTLARLLPGRPPTLHAAARAPQPSPESR
jgi:hypothetical protein